jgi:hypothetical protein
MPVYLLRTWAYHCNLGLASTKEQAAVLTAYATVLNETWLLLAKRAFRPSRLQYAIASI